MFSDFTTSESINDLSLEELISHKKSELKSYLKHCRENNQEVGNGVREILSRYNTLIYVKRMEVRKIVY